MTAAVQVILELGHRASVRDQPTAEGFTHDWVVFVRGHNREPVDAFIEKVVFQLHESFPRPRRVKHDPPYEVRESGYAGFLLPITVHFKNRESLTFNHDLILKNEEPTQNIRHEKLTFQSPSDEFRRLLIRAGGVSVSQHELGSKAQRSPVQRSSTSHGGKTRPPPVSTSTAVSSQSSTAAGQGGDDKRAKPPPAAAASSMSRSKSGSERKSGDKKHSSSAQDPFVNLFGTPIKKSSQPAAESTRKSTQSNRSSAPVATPAKLSPDDPKRKAAVKESAADVAKERDKSKLAQDRDKDRVKSKHGDDKRTEKSASRSAEKPDRSSEKKTSMRQTSKSESRSDRHEKHGGSKRDKSDGKGDKSAEKGDKYSGKPVKTDRSDSSATKHNRSSEKAVRVQEKKNRSEKKSDKESKSEKLDDKQTKRENSLDRGNREVAASDKGREHKDKISVSNMARGNEKNAERNRNGDRSSSEKKSKKDKSDEKQKSRDRVKSELSVKESVTPEKNKEHKDSSRYDEKAVEVKQEKSVSEKSISPVVKSNESKSGKSSDRKSNSDKSSSRKSEPVIERPKVELPDFDSDNSRHKPEEDRKTFSKKSRKRNSPVPDVDNGDYSRKPKQESVKFEDAKPSSVSKNLLDSSSRLVQADKAERSRKRGRPESVSSPVRLSIDSQTSSSQLARRGDQDAASRKPGRHEGNNPPQGKPERRNKRVRSSSPASPVLAADGDRASPSPVVDQRPVSPLSASPSPPPPQLPVAAASCQPAGGKQHPLRRLMDALSSASEMSHSEDERGDCSPDPRAKSPASPSPPPAPPQHQSPPATRTSGPHSSPRRRDLSIFTTEYLAELQQLQRRIMTSQDREELTRVFELINATGQIEDNPNYYDFDLCALDQAVVRKLQQCLLMV